MQEQRRQQYLEAMGIQPWFSRKVLPNALPSVRCEWQWPETNDAVHSSGSGMASDSEVVSDLKSEVKSEVKNDPQSLLSMAQSAIDRKESTALSPQHSPQLSATAAVPSLQPAQQPSAAVPVTKGLAQISNLLKTPAKQEAAVSAVSESLPDDSGQTESGPESQIGTNEVPRFRLEVIKLEDNKLIIAEVPHSAVGGFSRFHQQLLDDLLRSIDWSAETAARASFHWPVVSNGSIDQGEGVARDALRSYLQRDFFWDHPLDVLLLGRQSIEFIVGGNGDSPHQFTQRMQPGETLSQDGKTLVLCHSLNEMMKLPGLKCETWLHLSSMK